MTKPQSIQPAATARTPAPHVATTPQGTPSQPAPATQAITAAQRQQAYRQRNKRAVTQAIGDEARASRRVTLLALLGHDLVLLGDETARSRHSAARSSARRVINTLVTRYDINRADEDRT